MRSHIQFITTPTSDTPGTALMLHFDDKRYVFGQVHEGLQRAALQSGARFLKAKNFFLTGRTEWRNTGGMLGMILTLADGARAAAASKAETARLRMERKKAREEAEAQRNGKKYSRSVKSNGSFSQKPSKDTMAVEVDPTVRIHGGPNLLHTLATARSFVFRQGTPIEVKEFDEEQCGPSEEKVWKPTFMDNRIQVWAMHIRPISDAAPSPPVSPRKRSLDEYIFDEKNLRHYTDCERPTAEQVAAQWGIHTSQPKSNSQSDQQIRHTAVTEMFNSKWRFDNLVEKPLSQVKLPAAMFVRDPKTKKLARYEGPIPVANKPTPNIQVLVRQPWPGSLIDHLPPTQSSPVAMSYIVRNHRQRGRFKAEEAKRLNVPPGTLFAELAQGLSVTSTDGNIITPDMVLEPSKDGGGVAIFDLPSIDYIPALFQRPELVADAVMTGVGSFIWILGPGVAQDERLLRFMEEFKDMEHIVSSSDVCANVLTMTTAAIESLRHGQIDSDRFPHLHRNDSSPNQESFVKNSNLPLFRSATRGLKIQLEPKLAVVEDEIPRDLDKLQAQSEIPPKVFEFAEQARKDIATETAQIENAKQDLPSPSAEIVCLGTGSALPSLHRNVSATLLRVPGYGSYLLDCGENTLGQLRRMYTPAKLREVLGDLKLIWISHLHADHHLGTTSVIKAWYDAVHGEDAIKRPKPSSTDHLLHPETLLENGRRLFVVGHPYMIRWLDEYSSVEDFGYDQIVPLQATYKQDNTSDQCMLKWNGVDVGFNSSNNPRIRSAIREATGLSNLIYCPVSHCTGAHAVSLTFPDGFKFSYSGDCRPSRNFTQIGKNSTVLLHEATFDDEMKGDAIAKKHSTISEAIGVGLAMGARRVLLTHFSQRYSKIPNLEDLDKQGVKLEDAEDSSENPAEGIDVPVDISPEAHEPINNLLEVLDPESRKKDVVPESGETITKHDCEISSPYAPLIPSPQNSGMRIGIAFDYMHVKVKDIAHLEKFVPAMRELYKDKDENESADQPSDAAKIPSNPNKSGPSLTTKEVKSNDVNGELVKGIQEQLPAILGSLDQTSRTLEADA